LEKYFTSDNYNFTKLIGSEDEMRTIKKLKITLTSLKNQNNNKSTNKTTIDLGFCEILLKDFYNISYNDTLFLKIIEITQEGMKIPKVEFDIYSNLSGNCLEKLNLSICKNNEISLYIPVIIEDDSLDIYNSSSDYYNDICYPATSKSGTDIILNDRKNEFRNENRTLCQEDCEFVNYNYTSLKAQCLCKVKEFLDFDININKTKLLENFKNFKNISNIKIINCFRVLFSKLGIKGNIGFYIMMIIIIFHIACICIFYMKQLRTLKDKIKKIFLELKNSKINNKENEKELGKKLDIKEPDNIVKENTDIFQSENIIKKRKKKEKKKN
jgi:hypothetical protein